MKKNIFIALVIAFILVIVIFSFYLNKKDNVNNENKIKIITTLFPLYDFANQIGGEKVEVSLLLPPGIEAHSFEPKPSDIVKINESDLFIYTGKFMEPWAEDIIKGLSNKNTKIVDASLGINILNSEHEHEHEEADIHEHEEIDTHENMEADASEHEEVDTHEHEHEHGGMDPHIWLDFENDKIIIDNILAKLIEIDINNKDYYENNAINYKNKLEEMHNQYKSTLLDCENRTIIYSGHYAFGYLTSKYNLEYKSAYGLSPNTEPTAKNLIELVEQIKNDKIKYIFFEELLNKDVGEMLKNEANVSSLILNPAHNIKKEDYENKITFLDIMGNNLSNLKEGLNCK